MLGHIFLSDIDGPTTSALTMIAFYPWAVGIWLIHKSKRMELHCTGKDTFRQAGTFKMLK